jgi:DNA repair protein RadC
MKDVPKSDRPREKIGRVGVESLSDVELIAAIIGKGTKEKDVFAVAAAVKKRLEEGPSSLQYKELKDMEGMGETKACQLKACFELGRRYLVKGEAVKITAPEQVPPLVQEILDKKQEYFMVFTLNGAGEIIHKRIVTIGLLNHSLVHPREVFADAIADRAASVILVHNHPSGTLEPSSQDVAITRQLVEAGTLLGIQVLDHIIVARDGFVTMKGRGLM